MRTVIIALLVLVAACKKPMAVKEDMPDCGFGDVAYPACVQAVINNGSTHYYQIKQYVYNNKVVYLFMAKCCDRFNDLFDDQCNRLCAPSGGIGGGGDMNCRDFNQQPSLVRVVWQE